MEKLHIDTSQNVQIEHNLASIGERMLAHMIDYAIFFGYFMSMWMIGSILRVFESLAFIIIMLIPLFIYDLAFEYFYNGQSIGKKILRIKVVMLDGTPATISNYIVRWIFRVVDNLLLVGSIATFTIIYNGKGQRLGDVAAGTTVIRIGHRIYLSETLHTVLPKHYQPIYKQVKHLNEEDIATIKEVIDYYQNNNYTQKNSHFAISTKEIIEMKLNIKSDQLPLSFFKTVLMDYNFYNKA